MIAHRPAAPTDRRQSCWLIPAGRQPYAPGLAGVRDEQSGVGWEVPTCCMWACWGAGAAKAAVTPPWSSPAVRVRRRRGGEVTLPTLPSRSRFPGL